MPTAPPDSSLGSVPAKQSSSSEGAETLKLVPPEREQREAISRKCAATVAELDKSRTLGRRELEVAARAILQQMGEPLGYVGWTMVALASEFWREQVAAVPYSRRLLLLPVTGASNGRSRDVQDGAIEGLRSVAEELGYQVAAAVGSPSALSEIVLSGCVDAVLGVASLDVLEKALDRLPLAGIPYMAVPLLDVESQAEIDESLVGRMIRIPYAPAPQGSRTYVHLMRAASALFSPTELQRLVLERRSRAAATTAGDRSKVDPVAGTEAIAIDFLSRGGKHARPFITLAVYDAMTGGRGSSTAGAEYVAQLSDAVKRTALSIETFHKASLVHDDIEDDDEFRYGSATLHRQYGTPIAINVGDFLIGMGYRLVTRESRTLGAEVVADILDRLADAHLKLAEGQGAELLWRDSLHKQLTSVDAIEIYALKTAPAFEAALYAGLRLAGPLGDYIAPVAEFARNLGIAFQILNDLNDWSGDNHNKMASAGDTIGGRPTVLWALALETLSAADRQRLERIAGEVATDRSKVQQVRRLYQQAGVFEKALSLVEYHRQQAEAAVEDLRPAELRGLLYYLIETVLERPANFPPLAMVDAPLPSSLPVASGP